MKKENIVVFILGLAAVTSIIVEIWVSDSQSTKTESALFGILQFVFSLAFAWLLSRHNSKEEFESQQKKFAIAAFRRIKEIESQTRHLIRRLSKAIDGPENKYCHELDIAKTLAISISDTAQSSKLDWADIIGDQIETIETIENIQGESIGYMDDLSGNGDESSNNHPGVDVNELKKSLSTELKLSLENRSRFSTKSILRKQIEENGALKLYGFVDTKWANYRDPSELHLGEPLTIRIADEGNRIATLAAYDKDGAFVGSFLNRYPDSYSDFTRAACQVIGSSEFEGEIVAIKKQKEGSNRTHFDVVAHPLDA